MEITNELMADVSYLMAKGHNYLTISVILEINETQVFNIAQCAIDKVCIKFSNKKNSTFAKIKTIEQKLFETMYKLKTDSKNFKLNDDYKRLLYDYSHSCAL